MKSRIFPFSYTLAQALKGRERLNFCGIFDFSEIFFFIPPLFKFLLIFGQKTGDFLGNFFGPKMKIFLNFHPTRMRIFQKFLVPPAPLVLAIREPVTDHGQGPIGVHLRRRVPNFGAMVEGPMAMQRDAPGKSEKNVRNYKENRN